MLMTSMQSSYDILVLFRGEQGDALHRMARRLEPGVGMGADC